MFHVHILGARGDIFKWRPRASDLRDVCSVSVPGRVAGFARACPRDIRSPRRLMHVRGGRLRAMLLRMNMPHIPSHPPGDRPPIALVAAMKEELDALLAVFPDHEAHAHFNTQLYRTRHGDQALVIAQSGVGKVNAACTLALLLSDFAPACVINTGCAGGLMADQQVLDLVVPEEIVYTDVDITPLGFEYGQMMGSPPRFASSPELMSIFRELWDQGTAPTACHHGWLGSADSFISTPEHLRRIHEKFGGRVHCVEMEGAAIAHVCTRFGVPFLIIRALSDVPGRGENALDFQVFLQQAAANSAALCKALIERIARRGGDASR